MSVHPHPCLARRFARLRASLCSAALLLGAALAGCSSAPPAPDWQINAHSAAQQAVQAFLEGQARQEARALDRARAETARTGQPALMARLELLHCAAHVASLVLQPCAGFEALREDAAPPETAYARYLAGQLAPGDIALLPPAQQPLARAAAAGDQAGAAAALAQVQNPLSRLVASAVLLRTGQASPTVVGLAVDTASAQGWRRPLLAWLAVQGARAEAAGALEEAARVRRRMEMAGRQGGAAQ